MMPMSRLWIACTSLSGDHGTNSTCSLGISRKCGGSSAITRSRALGYFLKTICSAVFATLRSGKALYAPDQPIVGRALTSSAVRGLDAKGKNRSVSTAVGTILILEFHWLKYSAKNEFPQITESEISASRRANEPLPFSQIASSTSRIRGFLVRDSSVKKVESISLWNSVTS